MREGTNNCGKGGAILRAIFTIQHFRQDFPICVYETITTFLDDPYPRPTTQINSVGDFFVFGLTNGPSHSATPSASNSSRSGQCTDGARP